MNEIRHTVQSPIIKTSGEHISSIYKMGAESICEKYGSPTNVNMLDNGSMERVWKVDDGTLRVTHNQNEEVTDVKYLAGTTREELMKMVNDILPPP